MKTRNYIIAIASLILVSMMFWYSCEKENDLAPMHQASITANLDMPAEVAVSLSESEINAYYRDIETAEKKLPPRYMLKTIAITMDNHIEYSKAMNPIEIIFTGNGTWKDFGAIRYLETVNLLNKAAAPTGEGSIYLSRYLTTDDTDKFAPAADQLNFVSSMREEVIYEVGNPEKYAEPQPEYPNLEEKRVKSRLDFERSTGIFDAAYGIAYKVEYYYPDKPNYCKSVIYGYVAVKVDENS